MPTGLGGEKLWLCPTLDDSADDISGNGNHGTYNGGMGTVADTSNGGTRAYSFDGSDDYINTGNDVSANNTRSFSCWVYLDTQASRTFVASCYTSGTSTSQIKVAIGVNSSLQPYAIIQNGGAIAYAQSSSTLSTSQWYHIAGVFTSGSTKVADLYVDGVLDTTGSGTGNFPQLDETLVGVTARSNGALIAFMDGLQDDIRVFERALTTTEITALASKRGYEVPAAASGSIPHALSSPFHPLG